jgi:hypothetical protein
MLNAAFRSCCPLVTLGEWVIILCHPIRLAVHEFIIQERSIKLYVDLNKSFLSFIIVYNLMNVIVTLL